jgi:hypothetical protein
MVVLAISRGRSQVSSGTLVSVGEQQEHAQGMGYVIASVERFADGRVDRLRAAVPWLNFTRVDPTFTKNITCANNETVRGDDTPELHAKALGILLSHRKAWSAIAQSGRGLVLESDFSVGDTTVDELRAKIESAWARSDEAVTNVGWYSSVWGSVTRAPTWLPSVLHLRPCVAAAPRFSQVRSV